MKRSLQVLTAFILLVSTSTAVMAQGGGNRADVERFYKPVTSKDLRTQLPPRLGAESRFDGNDAFFTGDGGCPDQINIGSVTDGSSVFGGTDINVSIDGDIIVQCGGF